MTYAISHWSILICHFSALPHSLDFPRTSGAHNRLRMSREKEMSTLDSTHARKVNERALGAWMRANLTTQGYFLNDDERREARKKLIHVAADPAVRLDQAARDQMAAM